MAGVGCLESAADQRAVPARQAGGGVDVAEADVLSPGRISGEEDAGVGAFVGTVPFPGEGVLRFDLPTPSTAQPPRRAVGSMPVSLSHGDGRY